MYYDSSSNVLYQGLSHANAMLPIDDAAKVRARWLHAMQETEMGQKVKEVECAARKEFAKACKACVAGLGTNGGAPSANNG